MYTISILEGKLEQICHFKNDNLESKKHLKSRKESLAKVCARDKIKTYH